MVDGNIIGIKNSVLNRLDKIYELKVDKESIANYEMIEIIAEISFEIKKEISVAINRKGKVINVSIGDSASVELPLIDLKDKKLSGVRVIHTHPNGNPMLSAIDLSALLQLKLDAIVAVGVDEGTINGLSIGFCGFKDNLLITEELAPMSIEKALSLNLSEKIDEIEKFMKSHEVIEEDIERAILVGIESEESLQELEELSSACNINTVCRILQKRDKIDSALYIGKGKVAELAMLRQAEKADVIIFDDELSASQIRNLEDFTGSKVIDRTTLILEIFAKRAKSKEAKIQIELAQLKYRLPRLSGLGTVLSRTGGGIGTRGPGEKKLETDKRHIRNRIDDLLKELKKVKKVREVQRGKRTKDNIPKISLVGYTNAGKSTLRNKLCSKYSSVNSANKEKVFEADMLFATLDVTTRAILLPDNRVATLTDTVGFVKKLPHDLVEAFKSTLEEVINSDILIHVIDSSSDTMLEEINAVWQVLKELESFDKPMLLAFNKVDKVQEMELLQINIDEFQYPCMKISALEDINLEELMEEATKLLPWKVKEEEYLIPYDKGASVAYIHNKCKVLSEEYMNDGTMIKALVDAEAANKLIQYKVDNS
ncbi:GTPase HflX [Clostridium sediminicola]|uniref:GTPase HflX n=1 Tax=Clostridium sediminicola TaxID=3114879 RepID=UPI0031F22A68